MISRPMLSASALSKQDLEANMPDVVLASPKLDGIRCLIHPSFGPVSRNFKSIRNIAIHEALNKEEYNFLDGELITFTDGKIDDFNTIQSKVMAFGGEPDFAFYVFDHFQWESDPFMERLSAVGAIVENQGPPLHLVPHEIVKGVDAFLDYAHKALAMGWEGAMYRDPNGHYKSGRSTLRQSWLVKWKDIQDAEGKVVDFIERQHNMNPALVDAFGLIERSSHKEHMVGMDTLGALLLDTEWGTLRVGTGFDDSQRQEIWDNKDKYMGATVTFKYQPHGMQDLPRFPVFKGFRYDGD